MLVNTAPQFGAMTTATKRAVPRRGAVVRTTNTTGALSLRGTKPRRLLCGATLTMTGMNLLTTAKWQRFGLQRRGGRLPRLSI